MQNIPLATKPYQSAYYSIGIEQCKNLYLETSVGEGSKAASYLVGIPGLKLFTQQTSNSVICRGLYTNIRSFGVFGQYLYELFADGTRVLVGTLNSYTGPVSISSNNLQLIVVDGINGYILNLTDNSFTTIDSTDFPNGCSHVCYIDGYFIVNVKGTQKIQWSSNQDGTEWDGLNFAEADSNPDPIQALISCNKMAWCFGRNTIEAFIDTGDYQQQFGRFQSGIIQLGTYSPWSIAETQSKILFVGNDKSGATAVWMINGLEPLRVSTKGIEQLIGLIPDISDIVGYVYSQAGHSFYCISSQSGNVTYVYDLTVDAWHERTYLNPNTGKEYRWRGIYHTFNFSKNIFGDYGSDALFYTDMEYYWNDNPTGNGHSYIKRLKTSPIFYKENKRLLFREIQLQLQQGLSEHTEEIETNHTYNPKVMVEWSDDSGKSWSNQVTTEIGRLGEYAFRSRLFNLGSARNRVFRFSITDPVGPIIMVQLWANIVEGTR